MLYLNKFLNKIKEDSAIFKKPEIIKILGLTSTQIKDLKKHALENQLIKQEKQEYFLTKDGEKYLSENPLVIWATPNFSLRPNINIESLKDEKPTSVLTRAIRNIAKFLIEKQPLKEFSYEQAVYDDMQSCKKLISAMEKDILDGKRKSLEKIFEKYSSNGISKSLISLSILFILTENIERIAIYEKSQFQLKFDALMLDRMIACPQNFEIQKTEMIDEYILKDVSKIILNKKSNNILEITKGLYATIKSLDKYTMSTQNLSNKTLRLRNVILNAKDPISLFERDIPKVLNGKNLKDCNREFLDSLKKSLIELKFCTENLVDDLKKFFFNSFSSESKENLSERFLAIKEFISDKELKILCNSVIETEVADDLWINRIATCINKYRVPKDWSDEDYADFKVKTREFALKFFALEATITAQEYCASKRYHSLLNDYSKLTKPEKMIFLRKATNI